MQKYTPRHHVDINIEKTLIVFSHVEQPTMSKIILGRDNEQISAYSREEPAFLELNPLLWWQANSLKYPLLSTLSIFIWGISATSVPCERVFSTAGDTDTTQRSSLRPIQIDLLIILKKNIHKLMVDRCGSSFVFNFTKTCFYCLLGLLTCVSSIVSTETKSIKTCFIFLWTHRN